jgi:uncharacterized oxidoreductase
MPTTHHVSPELLERAAYEIFRANGSPEHEARQIAGQLVLSNLGGHDSHGVIRLPTYMQWLREGKIQPGARNTFPRDNGSTALIDGNWGYGQTAMMQAAEVAIERARAHGVSAVGVTRLMHIGRLADYALAGARAGMVSLVCTTAAGAGATVAPFGSIARRIATNPLAAGFPCSGSRGPVWFDMATSTVAEGKVQVARDAKKPLPEGILIDKSGNPTTNPLDLYEGGAILPAGGSHGYKGYLMAFMVEVLAGLLTGAGYVGKSENPKFDNCTFMICIDVARFRPLDAFTRELDQLIDYLKATPSRPGEEVLYPGEVEKRREAERRRTGIPLAEETVNKLQAELDRARIPLQLVAQAAAPLAG